MTNTLVTVVRDGTIYEVAAGMPVSFGRDPRCTICLDPDDAGISRVAGRVEEQSDRVWLVNVSDTRPFSVKDGFGRPHRVIPKRSYPLVASVKVLVDGSKGRHLLDVHVPESSVPEVRIPSGIPTATGDEVNFSDEDELALVALFAGYLQEGAHDPEPRTYEAAAKRLGWSPAKLRRKIEYLRERLTRAGVPNLTGPYAMHNLAEHVIVTRRITPDDLRRLRT